MLKTLLATLKNISYNPITNKYTYTFESDECAEVETDKSLSLSIKTFHKPRSLDANAYSWVLMGKIAEETKCSVDEIHENMLRRVGYVWLDENGNHAELTLAADQEPSKALGLHWICADMYWDDNGVPFRRWLLIRGSSQMDRKEFSHYLDEIIEEAKAYGIDPATPDEIERMKALWKA